MSSPSSDKILKLNVGEAVFQTTQETLKKSPKLLEVLEANSGESEIFIDRDPHHFRLILNFLRDGSTHLPKENKKKLQEIRAEAEFYQLQGLLELCQRHLPTNTPYQLIHNTTELFDVLMEAKKDVLVVKVSTDDEATIVFPYNRTDIDSFVEKYKDRCQVVFYLLKTMVAYDEWQFELYPIDKVPRRPGAEGFPDYYEEFDRADHRW